MIRSSGDEQRSSRIARRVRDDILSGRLAAGSRVTEAELSERFGVGRSLVREAVQQLTIQGLLVTRRNRGAEVAAEAPREIRQLIIPIRRTIEVYALKSAFDELQEEDFEHWESVLEKMRVACEEEDFHTIAECDLAFHRFLLERADQPDLLVIWDAIVGRIRSHFRRMQRRCTHAMQIYDEHRKLLDIYRAGDLENAVSFLEVNID